MNRAGIAAGGMTNDYDRPLGLNDPVMGVVRAQRRGGAGLFSLSSGPVAGFGSVATIAVVVGYAALFGSSEGGRARSSARITIAEAPPQAAAPLAPISSETTGSIPVRAPDGRMSAGDIERVSGVKVSRGNASAPGALIIQVDPATAALPRAPDPRLADKTKSGILPRIGADGAKPVDVYAKPFAVPIAKAALPRIALVLDGLGLSATTTRDALDKLPPAVDFAFAPYGDDLESLAAQARDKGHETILQIPMEPIDSAHNDPGPHTLQLAASAAETNANLKWLLGRFTGYFAVAPFLGGRFLQSEDALSPVMHELAGRGLGLIDDGSGVRPLIDTTGREAGVRLARAVVRLDADDPKGTEQGLAKLEAIAREKGFAVGSASALPASIERLARFTNGLETRGILLVPASALLGRTTGTGDEARR
jgi:polysaccharide deacetylase 2 family uncharacterized protein YibQ